MAGRSNSTAVTAWYSSIRGFSSLGSHLALVLFTGGVGNVVYAWYKYSYDADRELIRADEDDDRFARDGTIDDRYGRSATAADTADETAATCPYVAGALFAVLAVALNHL